MLIGFDFDNTIVNYDGVFHRAAIDRALIPADTPKNKLAVRDTLRQSGREDDWTELQGYVYGARMSDAEPYPGLLDVLRQFRARRITCAIVSHKTRHPFRGPAYDLHQAARAWIMDVLRDKAGALVPHDHIFLEVTKEDKLARIAELGCSHFIDDLPEILLAPAFPAPTQGILFDPDHHHAEETLPRLTHWEHLERFLA